MTGDATRAVTVVRVEIAGQEDGVAPGDEGRFVNLVLDRPLTPFPSLYELAWTDVYEEGLDSVTSGTYELFGAYRLLEEPQIEVPRKSRDLANPQTQSAAEESLPLPGNRLALGTFGVDSTGDYAADEGIASLKKRVARRLSTRKNAFAHLPGYGVGIPDAAKQLGTVAVLAALRADAEAQIAREPDVAQVRVVIVTSASQPDLVRFRVAIRPKVGPPVAFDVPFQRAA